MTALTGTEIVLVQAVQANGIPAASGFNTTTGAIAGLAGVSGVAQITLDGATSGTTVIQPQAVATGTILTPAPAGTDTFALLAQTQTLTNKTLTAPVLNLATLSLAAAQTGTFTANGTTPVVVAKASVTANSVIIFTLKTVGGTVGAYPAIQTITPTTGFTVAATAADTSVYNFAIIG